MYHPEEEGFNQKCITLNNLFSKNISKYNDTFQSSLYSNMNPDKSLKILKLLLTKSQLPYEMVYILGKTMQVAAIELGTYYNKDSNQIDAETMIPYLVYVVIRAVQEVSSS